MEQNSQKIYEDNSLAIILQKKKKVNIKQEKSKGSNKLFYLIIGLIGGFVLLILKVSMFYTIELKIIVSMIMDLLFFSYLVAGSSFIINEFFIRKNAELNASEVNLILSFVVSLGVFYYIKEVFFMPY